jgi:hypothetical protein
VAVTLSARQARPMAASSSTSRGALSPQPLIWLTQVADVGRYAFERSSFKTVEVDPNSATAVVGGGAKWGDVDQAAIKHGLAVVGGTNDDTGVAGCVVVASGWQLTCGSGLLTCFLQQPGPRRRLWVAVVERWHGLRQHSRVPRRPCRRTVGCRYGRDGARPMVCPSG